MHNVILGNTVLAWSAAAGVALFVLGAILTVRRVVLHEMRRLAAETSPHIDDIAVEVLAQTRVVLLAPIALKIGTLLLEMPDRLSHGLYILALTGLLLQFAIWADCAIVAWVRLMLTRWDSAKATTISMLSFVARVLLWSVVAFTVLGTFGFDVTTLVAGLGIGGVAVALAAQNVLGDLLASLSIVFDRPFLIGDFIVVDDKMGTVEHIGLKTTRLRSLSGEQLVFANADLLKSRIRNYQRMYERRVEFNIGVTYQTPPETLEDIPALVRNIIEARPQTRFDRAHLSQFGDSALLFSIVYFVLDPDYNFYMDTQQAVCLGLIREFQSRAIEFAYPTQTIQLQRVA